MEENNNTVNQIPKHKIAFIIDNQIVDILHTDDRLAAIFLSDPKIIDVSDYVDSNGNFALTFGMIYDEAENTFSAQKIYKKENNESE